MMSGPLTDAPLAFLAATQLARRQRPRQNPATIRLWFLLAQVCIVFLTGIAVWLIVPFDQDAVSVRWYVLTSGIGTIVAIEVMRHRRTPDHHATMVAGALSAGLSGGFVLLGIGLPWRLALSWTGAEVALSFSLLSGLRFAYADVVASLLAEGRLAKRVAIVGTGPAAARAVAELGRSDPQGLQIAGRYAADTVQVGGEHRGDMRTLLCDARLDMIDAIVLAFEPTDTDQFTSVRRALRPCIQDVLAFDDNAGATPGRATAQLGSSELVLLSQQPIRGASMAAKRGFDVVVACLLLAFMAPLLTILAIFIRFESKGPVLFRQLRMGYNNRLFYILKFRSMYWQESDRLAKQQTIRGDKRVTRVGRVIRKLSLDELPQLLNVVQGEMSLVGPRPHAPGTSIGGQRVHTLVDDYACRHTVRPGITGLAQVRGLRGGLQDRRQVADRIASDLEYIQRWSLWLDVRILLGTVLLELRDSRGC